MKVYNKLVRDKIAEVIEGIGESLGLSCLKMYGEEYIYIKKLKICLG